MGWLEGFSDLLRNLRVDNARFPARSWQSNGPFPRRVRPRSSDANPQDDPSGKQPDDELIIAVDNVGNADAALAAGNFSLAVWTAGTSRFTFYYDDAESHLILAGRAILTPVDRAGRALGPSAPVGPGQRARTPPQAAVLWEVLEPVTKRTTCREPFRMVASGWILQPPKRWAAWPPPAAAADADVGPADAAAAGFPPLAGNHTQLRPG
jgi:uncharacterized cupin superfamily protein